MQALYQLGGCKFFVNNVSPLGCQPFSIRTKSKPGSTCFEDLNIKVSAFNGQLQLMLLNLESSLPGSKFHIGDIFKLFMDVFLSPNAVMLMVSS